jgi:predicted RNA-binding Zn ribbon-like protein
MIPASHSFRQHNFGAHAPWMDLGNSEMWNGYGKKTDFLDEPQWIADFLKFWKFDAPSPSATELKELRRLRALIRELSERLAKDEDLRASDLEALNSWLKIPVIRRLVEHQNGLQLEFDPVQIGWPAVIERIAASMAESLLRVEHDRLRICANSGCLWIFVDGTKGKVKRWCSAATCGNRDRVRRARARER